MLLCFDVSQCRKYFEMRVFENMIVNLITTVYNFLWGDLFTIPLPGGGSLGISLLILLLIPTGIYFTIRTRFLPIRLFPDMIRALSEKKNEKSSLSSFQTLIVSTATRVGMGNLVGVVAAVSAGGAGAVFWMWVTAIIGSSTAFIEATLAQLYKEKDPLYGGYRGGPAYYIHAYVEEKQKKKDSKKLSSKSSFDDMIAYVDENGMITSTPPAENVKKEEINPDEIIIATPKKEDEEPVILRGRVEFFNEARGFGFIKDLAGVDKYFFHVNNVVGNISEGNIVTFDLERGVKGMNAVNICLEKKPVEN